MITINIKDGLHAGASVNIDKDKVYILIGKNGSGKSKLLKSIKQLVPDAILLNGNFERVAEITSIDSRQALGEHKSHQFPMHIATLVALDPTVLKIFQYYFKILFDADLNIAGNQFTIGNFTLPEEADGLKSIFNLLYYLVSDHELILLDEPERFFHPTMKTVFISLVSEIAKKYNKTIIIASHSKEVIRFDLDNIEVWLLSPAIINLKIWMSGLSVAAYSSAKEKNQFIDWVTYHTEVFFSKSIGLVEGVSDQIVLAAIKNKLSVKYNFENIVICHVAASHHEGGGKSRLHKMQSFLQL